MSDQPEQRTLSSLGLDPAYVEEAITPDLVTAAILVLRTMHPETGKVSIVVAEQDGLDWPTQIGLLVSAEAIVRAMVVAE